MRRTGCLLLVLLAPISGWAVEGNPQVEADTSANETSATAVQDQGVYDNLRTLLSNLNTLSANFVQRVSDTEGFEIQVMEGKMTVARPGNIRWQTQPPYEQLLVGDGDTLWLYDKDLEQVTVRPFMRDIANSPAMLFIGDISDLESQYRVNRAGSEQGIAEFTLIPVDASSVYQRLSISFRGKVPVAMGLWDSLGQLTRIEFSAVKINKPASNSLFRFKIPAGVDVLYND